MPKPEFSPDKSHEENIKVSIDKILGSNSVLKRGKKTAADHHKALFLGIIDQLVFLDIRDHELDSNFMLDLGSYNTPFYSVVDAVLSLHFNKRQCSLIHFYLYERITAEGFMMELTDQTGRVIDLSSHLKLYEELLKIK